MTGALKSEPWEISFAFSEIREKKQHSLHTGGLLFGPRLGAFFVRPRGAQS
jgi:hypothetical protein